MKKNIATCIELTETHIKFFQAPLQRGAPVSVVKTVPLSSPTDEEIEKKLKQTVPLKDIDGNHVTFIIPRRLTILRQLNLPSTREDEIKKMIDLQLVSQIPYPLSDVSYDHCVLSKDLSGYTRVLVVIVHKQVSARYVKFFNILKIGTGKLALSSFGLLGWLLYQEAAGQADIKEPSVFLDIDERQAEICFCHDKRLFFSRSVHSNEELIQQFDLSLRTYRKEEMGPAVKQILLSGSSPDIEALKGKLEARFNMPVRILQPTHQSDHPGVSLNAGIGLLLSDAGGMINLTSKEARDLKATQVQRRQLVKSAVLFVLAFALGVCAFGFDLYAKTQQLNDLEERITMARPKVERANRQISFVKFFKEKFTKRAFVPDLIYELNALAPADVSFRSLSLNEEGYFTIQGYSGTRSAVNDFQTGLLRAAAFKEINLQFATRRKIMNTEVTDFKIICRLADSLR